jgi:uncharacterized protein YbaA (DUF1428 family)
MRTYTDGFVIPVPQDKLDEYIKMATIARDVWLEHGALDYCECVGDDMTAEHMVSFLQLAGVKDGEVVIFAWITYQSREHRDEVNQKVMADPRMKCMMETETPSFDCARMAYGGFRVLVSS